MLLALPNESSAQFTFDKIHFTDDGTPTGTELVPDFRWHSCWWAMGASSAGNIYMAISNHLSTAGGEGNTAVFKYNPNTDQMTFLNDLKSVSTAQGNWLTTETQEKVHTRLIEHVDGRMYFATHDNSGGALTDHRGTHIYYIENDNIVDFSTSATQYLDKDMNTVVGNIGVHVENYGTISMELSDGTPNLLYGITYGDGHLYKLDLDTGAIDWIAKTGYDYNVGIIRHFGVDGDGNAYVPQRGATQDTIDIYKYDYAMDTWTDTDLGYTDPKLLNTTNESGWRMQLYSPSRDAIYFVSFDAYIYRFTFATEQLDNLGQIFLNPNPAIPNLMLSNDGQHIYSLIHKYGSLQNHWFVDFNIATGTPTTIANTITTYLPRDLLFGGFAKDLLGHAYMVGWDFAGTQEVDNIALFKIKIDDPVPVSVSGYRID